MAAKPAPVEDLEKNELIDRWKQWEFVDDVEELKCCRCNKLSIIHFYTDCKHALCPNCKRLLSVGGVKCPQCDQLIQHIDEKSTNFEKKLNDLCVKCPNNKYGCPLVTTVQQLPDHLKSCEWLKEKMLPAIYGGTNTNQLLIEEVSELKKVVYDLKFEMLKLDEDLNLRQVEEGKLRENIGKLEENIEKSNVDINFTLNGLRSDSQNETDKLKLEIETLKVQMQTVNQEKPKDYEERIKQNEKDLSELNGKYKVLFKLVDQKEEKLQKQLSEKVKTINAKLSESKDNINAIKNENHRILEEYELQQKEALEKCKEEISTLNEELKEKVEFSYLRDELSCWQQSIMQIEKTVEKTPFKSENDRKELIENLNTKFTQIINTNLGQMEEKFRQKFSKEIETIKEKIAASEEKIAKIKQQNSIHVRELEIASNKKIQGQTLVLKDIEKEVVDFSDGLKKEFALSDLREKFRREQEARDNFQKTTERSIEEMKRKFFELAANPLSKNIHFTTEDYQDKQRGSEIKENIDKCNSEIKRQEVALNQLKQEIVENFNNLEHKIIIETDNVKRELSRQEEVEEQNKAESSCQKQQATLLQQQFYANSKELRIPNPGKRNKKKTSTSCFG